jgi:hypothetical protein
MTRNKEVTPADQHEKFSEVAIAAVICGTSSLAEYKNVRVPLFKLLPKVFYTSIKSC